MTETEIRKVILDYLETITGCAVRAQQKHMKNRANRTPPGWPDLSGYYRGRGLFIEVKRPGGVASLEQVAFIEKAKSFGHLAFFATGIGDVKRELGL